MATLYSPKIVTAGLVLCLDAGNTKSYIGSGTTWNDLTGNNNTGTLTNGPTFTGSFGGSVAFDGVNDYVACPTSLLDNYLSGTISAWINLNSITGSIITSRQRDAVGTYCIFSVGSYASSGGNLATGTPGKLYWHGKNAVVQASSSNGVSVGTYYNVTVTFSSTQAIFYINGVYDSTTSGDYSAGDSGGVLSPNYTQIGCWNNNSVISAPLSGTISSICVYNRTLTASEVLQNYNATKARFAL